ncbi:hypothetical protein I3842_15G147500 [Carya illinoinensis]|uniref:Integrase catalytic domain-containing protein n=1 Tax=Carya illinoinensis TaxID=32201 RepID=A0A922D911_CARIL|nr:hypothetical protein I3842_15G147500 [Carya illinoinensis]
MCSAMSETEVTALKDTLQAQQKLLQKLYIELDQEREASSTAASEALSMILRLQEEKAVVQMEASQYKRLAEEKMSYAENSLSVFEDLMHNKEMEIASLEFQVEAYRWKLLSMGCGDLGAHESRFPENLFLQMNDSCKVETGVDSIVRRWNSLPSIQPKDLHKKENNVERERSGIPVSDLVPKMVKQNTDQEINVQNLGLEKRAGHFTSGTFDLYLEQIRALDEQVKEISDCKVSGKRNSASLKSENPQESTGKLCDQTGGESITNLDRVKLLDHILERETIVSSFCPSNVQDIFEVPQTNGNCKALKQRKKEQSKPILEGENRLGKPDLVARDTFQLNMKEANKMLCANHDNKLCKARNAVGAACNMAFIDPRTGVSECEASFQRLSQRIERLEGERICFRQEISEAGDEELKFLKEIREQLNMIQTELRSWRTTPIKKRSWRSQKSPPQDQQPLHSLTEDLSSWMTIGVGKVHNGLYHLQLSRPHLNELQSFLPALRFNHVNTTSVSKLDDFTLWHYRLGHSSMTQKILNDMQLANSKPTNSPPIPCEICPLAKQHKLPFTPSETLVFKPFDLIAVDIWGPNQVQSYNGTKYFLTIVDQYTRCTWIYLLQTKSEARTSLQNFIALAATQFESQIKTIRSDNGAEFHMPSFYQSKGILHQRTCIATPQQNALAERKHQHILNVARALKFQSGLPMKYWTDFITTAVHLINRTPTPQLHNKSPFELLYNQKPSYSHLRTFGCLCFASTLSHTRSKFDPRARKCLFLGYPYGVKGYKLLDLTTQQIFLSRDIVFHEQIFPLKRTNDPHLFFPFPHSKQDPSQSHVNLPNPTSQNPLILDTSALFDQTNTESFNHNTSPPPVTPTIAPSPSPPPITPTIAPSPSTPLRRSTRTRTAPAYLKDFHCNALLPHQSASMSKAPESSFIPGLNISFPLSSVLSYSSLSPSFHAFTTSLSINTEPTTYNQAIKQPIWREAMQQELIALELNNTWSIVDLPHGKKPIACKWLYRYKFKADGSIERAKARLVAKGFTNVKELIFMTLFLRLQS